MSERPRATYATAGVNIEAGDRAVELMRPWAAKTRRSEVLGGLGGFAGLFRLDLTRWRNPVLASSIDGVGTKLAIAQAMDKHDTIGLDLVGMVADDVVVCGAEPLFLQDYIACGQVVPERLAQVVAGVAEGCRQAGCSLVGGETAEHPGMLGNKEYDVAGAAVGVVEADDILGPARVRPGDVVIGMASSGLHSNGYSLVRHVLLGDRGLPLDSAPEQLDGMTTLGEELLIPTRIYAADCLALTADADVHAFAHITGGGLAANLVRVLPPTVNAELRRSTWRPQPIFSVIADRGRVAQDEMERTFNMGLGMAAVVNQDDAERALAILIGRGVTSWVAGGITEGDGQVRLSGSYAR
ncbi:MAG: phosphoribosylformylglycinamidine cyclo-ligase [Mycobacteriales bacterium]